MPLKSHNNTENDNEFSSRYLEQKNEFMIWVQELTRRKPLSNQKPVKDGPANFVPRSDVGADLGTKFKRESEAAPSPRLFVQSPATLLRR